MPVVVTADSPDGVADAVYGSRFASSGRRRVLYFWHSVANHILTTLCNVAADLNLTDVESATQWTTSATLQDDDGRNFIYGSSNAPRIGLRGVSANGAQRNFFGTAGNYDNYNTARITPACTAGSFGSSPASRATTWSGPSRRCPGSPA